MSTSLRQRHVTPSSDDPAPTTSPDPSNPPPPAAASSSGLPSASTSAPADTLKDTAARDRDTATPFDCNICLDMPNDPVVTACGHLYCWSCLYKWMRLHAEAPQCPVCKSSVERHKVTPIYGRGRSSQNDPRLASAGAAGGGAAGAGDVGGEALPPRPVGQRDVGVAAQQPPPFGFHPAAFGRVNAYGTYGLFPNLFGMQIAYPHINDAAPGAPGGREVPELTPQLTPEEETQEQVVRVFLFLAFFIVCSVSFF